ncbi:MAG TPA: hypothetical protein VGJ70_26225, partial [Solirubrobacteraceae bacterium]
MTVRRHGRRALALTVLAAAVVAGGCGAESKPVAAGPPGEFALGLPVEQAVAQLFAVGFAGTGPQAPIMAKLRARPWGAVVLHAGNMVAPFQTRTLIGALRQAGRTHGRPEPLIMVAEPHEFPGVRVDPQPTVGSPAVA